MPRNIISIAQRMTFRRLGLEMHSDRAVLQNCADQVGVMFEAEQTGVRNACRDFW